MGRVFFFFSERVVNGITTLHQSIYVWNLNAGKIVRGHVSMQPLMHMCGRISIAEPVDSFWRLSVFLVKNMRRRAKAVFPYLHRVSHWNVIERHLRRDEVKMTDTALSSFHPVLFNSILMKQQPAQSSSLQCGLTIFCVLSCHCPLAIVITNKWLVGIALFFCHILHSNQCFWYFFHLWEEKYKP